MYASKSLLDSFPGKLRHLFENLFEEDNAVACGEIVHKLLLASGRKFLSEQKIPQNLTIKIQISPILPSSTIVRKKVAQNDLNKVEKRFLKVIQ